MNPRRAPRLAARASDDERGVRTVHSQSRCPVDLRRRLRLSSLCCGLPPRSIASNSCRRKPAIAAAAIAMRSNSFGAPHAARCSRCQRTPACIDLEEARGTSSDAFAALLFGRRSSHRLGPRCPSARCSFATGSPRIGLKRRVGLSFPLETSLCPSTPTIPSARAIADRRLSTRLVRRLLARSQVGTRERRRGRTGGVRLCRATTLPRSRACTRLLTDAVEPCRKSTFQLPYNLCRKPCAFPLEAVAQLLPQSRAGRLRLLRSTIRGLLAAQPGSGLEYCNHFTDAPSLAIEAPQRGAVCMRPSRDFGEAPRSIDVPDPPRKVPSCVRHTRRGPDAKARIAPIKMQPPRTILRPLWLLRPGAALGG